MARLRWDSGKGKENSGAGHSGGGGGNGSGGDTRILVDVSGRGGIRSRLARLVAGVAGVIALVMVLEAVHWLPSIHNPFAETTVDRSQPVLLKSITELHRYEAASGEFQVVVELQSSSFLPSFIQGSDTLFLGIGTDNAYVDFSTLTSTAVQVSSDRLSATIKLPHAKLEGSTLDVSRSHVIGAQQGLVDRLSQFLGGDPNSAQELYVTAKKHIDDAAGQSQLIKIAEGNTQNMLTGLLRSLGFKDISVSFS